MITVQDLKVKLVSRFVSRWRESLIQFAGWRMIRIGVREVLIKIAIPLFRNSERWFEIKIDEFNSREF